MSARTFEIRLSYTPTEYVFHLVGEFDAQSASAVRRAVAHRMASGTAIKIDCAELDWLAAEVLGTLVTCGRLASTFGTPFEICNLAAEAKACRDGIVRNVYGGHPAP